MGVRDSGLKRIIIERHEMERCVEQKLMGTSKAVLSSQQPMDFKI